MIAEADRASKAIDPKDPANYSATGFPLWLDPKYQYRRYLQIHMLGKAEKGHCHWCWRPVGPGRRTWCSDDCVDQYLLRASGNDLRKQTLKRDKGVCAECGMDCLWLLNQMRRIRSANKVAMVYDWRDEQKLWGPWAGRIYALWDADHIVSVKDGGGCCGLENIRTLCMRCHKNRTKLWHKERIDNGQLELF